MGKDKANLYTEESLRKFCEQVFISLDIAEEDARIASDVLITSDLRGINTHGVARMYSYVEMLQAGRINTNPEIKIIRESASTATMDGDNGLGLVVGVKANKLAIKKAKEAGTGWVAVNNTNHYGIAGYYSMESARNDCVGWCMTNSTKLVAPLWGAEAMLGTNPIAYAFPGGKEPMVVVDMSTSAVAYGKIEMASRIGEQVPDGWCIDSNGTPTNDPEEMKNGGALLPLGSTREMGGHKGYALGIAVDLFSALLSGANWGPFTPPFTLQKQTPSRSVGKGIGHFFGAFNIEAFRDLEEYKQSIDEWIQTFRNCKPAPGTNGPIIPGDPEREQEELRMKSGIPLYEAVEDELKDISDKTGVPFPQNI